MRRMRDRRARHLRLGCMVALALGVGGAEAPGQARPGAGARGALAARWIGQDGSDRAGPGIGVGPDRIQDARIELRGLAAGAEVKWVRVEAPGGRAWESGLNPRRLTSAEFVRDRDDPTRGDLYFAPAGDLRGVPLRLTLGYDGGRSEGARLAGGRIEPGLPMPAVALPEFLPEPLRVTWLGQDGTRRDAPGLVHLGVAGLPEGAEVGAVTLSDPAGWLWVGSTSPEFPVYRPGSADPLFTARRADGGLDLHFTPRRAEADAPMLLRVDLADGRHAVARLRAGPCDLARTEPARSEATAEARPGDDLQALVARGGRLTLAPGVYHLESPLKLPEPISIKGPETAILAFTQAEGSRPWWTAIEIQAGGTSLEGFSVRFDAPVRWDPAAFFGPAVIGHGDNPAHPAPRVGVRLEGLNLRGPSPALPNLNEPEAAPLLIRLPGFSSGRIVANRLYGGPVKVFGGPWEISDNVHQGTQPGTYCSEVFSSHDSRGLTLRRNRASGMPPTPHGKTWRFLVLATSGIGDLVAENVVEGVGHRDGEAIAGMNMPEIFLTEAYRLHFEGRSAAVSADGFVVRVAGRQGEPPAAGSALGVLTGPEAGRWVRIAQVLNNDTYLLDAPIPDPDAVISIATGFVNERFERNQVDTRGGSASCNLVLVGNHFGTVIRENTFLGGGGAMKVTAAPTEEPVHWGWSRAPALGLVIRDNTFDQPGGIGMIAVEYSEFMKTISGRVYMSVDLRDNRFGRPTGRSRRDGQERRASDGGPTLWLGEGTPPDPGAMRVSSSGNAAIGTPRFEPVRIRAATVNGRPLPERPSP